MLKIDLLEQYRPFTGLNEQLLSKVTENVKVARAAKGDIIFKRGKVLTDLYFLIDGEVDLINNEFGIEKVKLGLERRALPLNESSPTAVSAIAKSRVTYFTVDAEWLGRLISGLPETEDIIPSLEDKIEGTGEMEVCDLTDSDDWMSCILQSPVFSRIPMGQLQELFTRFENVAVKTGEKIVKEGAPGDFFYVVVQGTCHITNRSGSVDIQVSQGGFFGEEALLSSAPRNATVEMTSDGILKRLNAEDFVELVKQPVLKYIGLNEINSIGKSFKVLDVRMPVEYRAMHFPGSLNIPLARLRSNLRELGHGSAYLISSEAGTRAEIAAYILCQAGFEAVILTTLPADQSSEALLQAS